MENVGGQLKKIRIERGMTLEQVSNKCGYSKALISRVENGYVSPSLASLTNMLRAMGLQICDFFLKIEQNEPVILRQGDRQAQFVKRGVKVEHLTSGVTEKKMDPAEVTIPSGYSSDQQRITYSECFILVRAGEVKLVVGIGNSEEVYRLNAGDSIYLPAGISHRCENTSKQEAILLCVESPSSR